MRKFFAAAAALFLTTSLAVFTTGTAAEASCKKTSATIVIPLTSAKHAQVIAHAKAAVKKGYPRTMVLNRTGADARRRAAMKGIPTKSGYDRDEYPAAVGRKVNKADVKYVKVSQNRSAGAIMGNKLRPYCNGVKFRYAGV